MAEGEALHPLRPFLRNWVWEHGQVGTRYLDCRSGELRFDDGRKARFADGEMFHVSLAQDADEAAHRAGPAIRDGALARFLHAAQVGRPDDAGAPADMQRAVQDCLDLALMCAYQPQARAALARLAQEALFEHEIRAEVIAEIRRSYAALREQLALYDFTVLHNLPTPLLITESPFIDWRVRAKPAQPFVSLPLGPYCLLVGTPSGKKSKAGPVLWKSGATLGPLKDHNRLLVESAAEWIVATTDEQLAAVQPRFAPPAADEAAAKSAASARSPGSPGSAQPPVSKASGMS